MNNFRAVVFFGAVLLGFLNVASTGLAQGKAVDGVILNASAKPIFADSVALDPAPIYKALAIPEGSPLKLVTSEGRTLPAVFEEFDGVKKVRVYLSLKSREKVDFSISHDTAWAMKPADLCKSSWDAASKTAKLGNGILELVFAPDSKGRNYWSLSMDGPMADSVSTKGERRVIYECLFSNYVSPEFKNDRLNSKFFKNNPAYTPVSAAGTIVNCTSRTLKDGSVEICVERTYTEHAKDLVSKDYFTLVRGLPLLRHIMIFENRGKEPRYMPFANEGSWMDARIDPKGLLSGTRTMIPAGKIANSEEGAGNVRPGIGGGVGMWMNIVTDNGAALGIIAPKSCTYNGDSPWCLQRNPAFKLSSPDLYRGPFPLEISADKPLIMGMNYMVFQGEVDSIKQMAEICELTKKEKEPEKNPGPYADLKPGKAIAVFIAGEPVHFATVTSVIDDFKSPERCIAGSGVWTATNGVARLEAAGGKPGMIQYALNMDLKDKQVVELKLSKLSPGASVEVKAIAGEKTGVPIPALRLKKGEAPPPSEAACITPLSTAPFTTAGVYVFDLSKATRWASERNFAVAVSVNGGAAELAGISISRPRPAAPVLGWPLEGQNLTDMACQFTWIGVPQCTLYQVQIAADDKFATAKTYPLKSVDPRPYYYPLGDNRIKAGTYFWRVCAINSDGSASDWSEARKVVVNDDHSKAPKLVREVSVEHPLYFVNMNCYGSMDKTNLESFIRNYKATSPREVAEHTAFNLGFEPVNRSTQKERDFKEYFRTFDENSQPYFWCGNYRNLPQIEWQYQNVKNCTGIAFGEHMFWLPKKRGIKEEDSEYVKAVMRLSAKYGKYYFSQDGIQAGGDKWHWMNSDPESVAIIKEHSRNIILLQKNNIFLKGYLTQNSILGMWLTGRVGTLGTHHDSGFYWVQAGMGKLNEYLGFEQGEGKITPTILTAQVWIHGLNQGATSLSSGDQLGRGYLKRFPPGTILPPATQYTTGEPTEWYAKKVMPLLQATITHKLCPTREQVLDSVKLAVYHAKPYDESIQKGPQPFEDKDYKEYWPLFKATYGFRDIKFKDAKGGDIVVDSEKFAYWPTTGRYGYFPVLPYPESKLADAGGKPIAAVAFEELGSVDKVKSVFDAAYPRKYEGGALLVTVGDLITVMSGHENDDAVESFYLPLGRQRNVKVFSGKIGPHAYIVGKWENNNSRIWFQANNEYDTDINLKFICDVRPEIQELSETKLKSVNWDPAKKELSLVINNKDGVVEFNLGTAPSTTPDAKLP